MQLTCSYRDCARILPGTLARYGVRPDIVTSTAVGLSEGLEGMRAGGCRRVHLPPSAPARTEWGDEGMEELQEETLVLGWSLYLLFPHHSPRRDRDYITQSRII